MLEEQIDNVSALLKSISHPMRLRTLCLLLEGEKTVGELRDTVQTTTANISQHLSVLRNHGIVTTRKEANFIYNRIADHRMAALVDTLQDLFCENEDSRIRRSRKSLSLSQS